MTTTSRLNSAMTRLRTLLRGRSAPRVVAPTTVDAMPGPVPATSSAGIVLVCLRCAQKVEGGIGEDGRTSLRTWLRGRLAHDGTPKALRVVETSCLGFCPKNAITVALPRDLAGTAPSFYALSHADHREALYTHVLRPAIAARAV